MLHLVLQSLRVAEGKDQAFILALTVSYTDFTVYRARLNVSKQQLLLRGDGDELRRTSLNHITYGD